MKIFLFILTIMVFPNKVMGQLADLSISISNNAIQPIRIRDVFTFVVTANNNGPNTANSASILSISENVIIDSSDCSGLVIGNIILWNSGELSSQNSYSCSINVLVNNYGRITINGHIDISNNSDIDPNMSNNSTINTVNGAAVIIPVLSINSIFLLIFLLLIIAIRVIRNKPA